MGHGGAVQVWGFQGFGAGRAKGWRLGSQLFRNHREPTAGAVGSSNLFSSSRYSTWARSAQLAQPVLISFVGLALAQGVADPQRYLAVVGHILNAAFSTR